VGVGAFLSEAQEGLSRVCRVHSVMHHRIAAKAEFASDGHTDALLEDRSMH